MSSTCTSCGASRMLVTLTVDEFEAMVERAVKRGSEIALRAVDSKSGMLNHADAARRLGMSTHALHRRVAAGDITPRKRGGRDGVRSNLFAVEDVEAYVRGHKAHG